MTTMERAVEWLRKFAHGRSVQAFALSQFADVEISRIRKAQAPLLRELRAIIRDCIPTAEHPAYLDIVREIERATRPTKAMKAGG